MDRAQRASVDEDRGADRLHQPGPDEDGGRVGDPADRGGGGEGGETEREGPPAAEPVGRPAGGHQERRDHHVVAVELPGQGGQVGGVEGLGDVGERHVHDGAVQECHAGAEAAQRDQLDGWPGGWGGGGLARHGAPRSIGSDR